MPAWMRSWPASAENSSMRAFTSWRVTRSRASMLARSTLSITATWSSITSSGRSSAEVVLGPQDRHPELPLEHHLALRRPDVGHRPAGVAGGQHVRAGGRRASPPVSHPEPLGSAPRSGRAIADVGRSALIGLRGSRRLVTRPLPRGRSCAARRRTGEASDVGQLWQAPARDGRRPLPTVRRRRGAAPASSTPSGRRSRRTA